PALDMGHPLTRAPPPIRAGGTRSKASRWSTTRTPSRTGRTRRESTGPTTRRNSSGSSRSPSGGQSALDAWAYHVVEPHMGSKRRLALAGLLLSAGCSSPGVAGDALSYKVDPGVTPVSDARPLGAVRDASGTTSSFVLDEVIVPAADLD